MLLRKGRIVLMIGLVFLGVVILWPIPNKNTAYSNVMLASNGELLGASIAKDGQWRFPVIDSVPNKFTKALLTFEDKRFYQHWYVTECRYCPVVAVWVVRQKA